MFLIPTSTFINPSFRAGYFCGIEPHSFDVDFQYLWGFCCFLLCLQIWVVLSKQKSTQPHFIVSKTYHSFSTVQTISLRETLKSSEVALLCLDLMSVEKIPSTLPVERLGDAGCPCSVSDVLHLLNQCTQLGGNLGDVLST